jgi:hypothetical protein
LGHENPPHLWARCVSFLRRVPPPEVGGRRGE